MGILTVSHLLQDTEKQLKQKLTPCSFAVGPVYTKERDENIAKWLHDGSFKAKESVTDGIDNAPEGFVGMLEGKNFGKTVLKIADLEVRDAKL